MMRVADLAGADLDLWVAKAAGVDAVLSDPYPNGTRSAVTFYSRDHNGVLDGRSFCPSAHWSDGGPLIEKHEITLAWQPMKGEWMAGMTSATMLEFKWLGFHATPLIAAMRALVASVYGDSVGEVVT